LQKGFSGIWKSPFSFFRCRKYGLPLYLLRVVFLHNHSHFKIMAMNLSRKKNDGSFTAFKMTNTLRVWNRRATFYGWHDTRPIAGKKSTSYALKKKLN